MKPVNPFLPRRARLYVHKYAADLGGATVWGARDDGMFDPWVLTEMALALTQKVVGAITASKAVALPCRSFLFLPLPATSQRLKLNSKNDIGGGRCSPAVAPLW